MDNFGPECGMRATWKTLEIFLSYPPIALANAIGYSSDNDEVPKTSYIYFSYLCQCQSQHHLRRILLNLLSLTQDWAGGLGIIPLNHAYK